MCRTRHCSIVALLLLGTACDSVFGPEDPKLLAVAPAPLAVGAGICAIATDRDLYCWGKWGAEALTRITVAGAGRFEAVSDRLHTCAITSTGTAYCWGANDSGQLGKGDATPTADPVPVSGGHRFAVISAGREHTCAITTERETYCWGAPAVARRGPDECPGPSGAYACAMTPVRVSTSSALLSLAPSASVHTCGLDGEARALCWGSNYDGQLGYEGESVWSNDPRRVSGNLKFVALGVGGSHTCGLTAEGQVYCWGNNGFGQLGTLVDVTCPSGMWCSREPVPVSGALEFTAIAVGGIHTCGLTTSGHAYCWGSNHVGQLGNPSVVKDSEFSPRTSTPVPVVGEIRFALLSAGAENTCGITESGELYCWGSNQYRRLGADVSGEHSNVPLRVHPELTFLIQ